MRFRYTTREQPRGGAEAAATSVTNEVDVPGSTILKAITSIGGVAGLVGGLVTLLGFWLRELPQSRQTRAMEEGGIRMQVLAQALLPQDSVYRANSVRLLLAASILDDSNGTLEKIAANPAAVPQWAALPPSALCGSVGTSSLGGAAGVGAAAPPSGATSGSSPPDTTSVQEMTRGRKR